jgi:hypothetical protein
MERRFIFSVLIAACVGIGGLVAAERATLILSDGERVTGTVVSRAGPRYGDREFFNRNDLNLQTDDGREIPIRLDQVAVIQFGGGRTASAELDALPDDHTQMIVRRDGSIESGRLLGLTAGADVIRWQPLNGRQRTIPFRDLTRIYLNADGARAAFKYTDRRSRGFPDRHEGRIGDRNDPGVSDRNSRDGGGIREWNSGEVRVEANQGWTSTGLNVRAGDLVMFRASGRISFGQGSTQTAGVDGNESLKRAEYPASGMPVGSLIGRVGGAAPFVIGSHLQPLRMPASGALMLGVNDNELTDNSGFFTVAIARQ